MNPPTLIIEPGLADRHYWRDLWRYRELFYVLAWRDIAVRYKQTLIGLAWALVRPLLTMIVFTLVFGTLARMPTEGTAPYALLVFAGLLPWQFFSTALTESSNSLIGNANLISKVYFPRLIVPTAAVVVSFVDFLISFAILVLVMVWYHYLPGWRILTLPLFVLMAFLSIPTESGQRFRAKVASDSDAKWPPFPNQSGQRFRRPGHGGREARDAG